MVKRSKEFTCETCPAGKSMFSSSLDNADLLYLNNQKSVHFYRKGEDIYHEGHKTVGIYCLMEGKVKVYKQGNDGREYIIRFVLPGEFIGLKALVTGNNHTTSASALEDSYVCFVTKTDFFQLMVKYPEFTRLLILTLSQLIEEAELKMTSLAQKPVKERLAEALIFLNKSFNAKSTNPDKTYLNLTRNDLSNIIGTAPETVIRLLSEFKDEKLISIKGRKIFITNNEELTRLANISI